MRLAFVMNIDQYKADSPVISSIKDNEQLNAIKSTNFIVMIPCSEMHMGFYHYKYQRKCGMVAIDFAESSLGKGNKDLQQG